MESYGRRIVVDLPFERGLAETIQALTDEGIDVIGRFDVNEYLDRTLHHDFRRYVLLEVVAPQLTLDALRHDLGIGAILPTTIAVFELADGETAVIVSEPFGGLGSKPEWRQAAPSLAALADQACDQLAHALSRLQRGLRNASRSPVTIEQPA